MIIDISPANMAIIELKNIYLPDDCNPFHVNQFFYLQTAKTKTKDTTIVALIEDKPTYDSAPTIFRNALYAAFPDILIQTKCLTTSTEAYRIYWKQNSLMSYYGYSNYHSPKCNIVASDLRRLELWHQILIEQNKEIAENQDLRCTPWNYAWNEYLSASTCGFVEQAITHLITALEALLINSTSELSYRVALYTSVCYANTSEDRASTFALIKDCYHIRSQTVHGDIVALKKKLKKSEIYEPLFRLKAVVSHLLFTTYGKDKTAVVNAIEEALFNCSCVTL